jgi:hypothetical protein
MVKQIQNLQTALSNTYIEFLTGILSVHACAIANKQ